MKPSKLRRLALLAASCALGACVAAPPPPAPPAPEPVVAPTPTPVLPPVVEQPVYDNWMDAPQTPGDWTLRQNPGETLALFGSPESEPSFYLRCDQRTRLITLAVAAEASVPEPVRIRTETRDRILTFSDAGSELPFLVAVLPAQDLLLDAMALSRGRFAVEVAGYPALYLPSWPEVTRVVEDCR